MAATPSPPIPKYALLENERRFLVLQPPGLAGTRPRLIEDLYLDDGRLRLRRISHADGAATEYKLCKKYGSADSASGPIVNIYLSAEEHAALAVLPGKPLRKRRHTVEHGREVTDDPFFSGGCLATLTAEALATRLAAETARA
jgi:hypothetical protein